MFLNTMTQWLAGVRDGTTQNYLRSLFTPLFDRQTSHMLNSAALAIKAGGSAIVKSGASDAYALATGVVRKITAATDMPALVGTVANATFNVFCFFIDSGGTVTSQMGTAGATLAAMKFPQFPQGQALVGFIIVNPTGTGGFVGGTTPLDDATVVPNVVYISPVGGFDPACLVG
jgi:hypothetical protein